MATYEKYQGKGYGKKLIRYILDYYKGKCTTMIVGTGDSNLTIPFYENCGFRVSHRIKNFLQITMTIQYLKMEYSSLI